jgi:cell wall-associated NlpC family hydrolase
MIERPAIVAEARTWLHTRYRHQAHTKGLATDCIGLIAGVGVAVGSLDADAVQRTRARHEGYSRQPSHGILQTVCDEFLLPIALEQAQAGDVVLMRIGTEPAFLCRTRWAA